MSCILQKCNFSGSNFKPVSRRRMETSPKSFKCSTQVVETTTKSSKLARTLGLSSTPIILSNNFWNIVPAKCRLKGITMNWSLARNYKCSYSPTLFLQWHLPVSTFKVQYFVVLHLLEPFQYTVNTRVGVFDGIVINTSYSDAKSIGLHVLFYLHHRGARRACV